MSSISKQTILKDMDFALTIYQPSNLWIELQFLSDNPISSLFFWVNLTASGFQKILPFPSYWLGQDQVLLHSGLSSKRENFRDLKVRHNSTSLTWSGIRVGETMLIFGCFSQNSDFLYKDTLLSMKQKGIIDLLTGIRSNIYFWHVFLAFSHDQPRRVFVQHRMVENSHRVLSLLKNGGHIYVCGYKSLKLLSHSKGMVPP